MDKVNFSWEDIGDLNLGRPNLGLKTDVAIYRLMQYTMRSVLETHYGEETCRALFCEAGKAAGIAYCAQFLDVRLAPDAFIAQLNQLLLEHQVGLLRVEKADLEQLHLILTVSEDLDCSGLPIKGKTVCDYDEGFLAGIMETYIGKEFYNEKVGLLASFFYAINGVLIELASGRIATDHPEILFVFFIELGIFLSVYYLKHRSFFVISLIGIATGCAMLTK